VKLEYQYDEYFRFIMISPRFFSYINHVHKLQINLKEKTVNLTGLRYFNRKDYTGFIGEYIKPNGEACMVVQNESLSFSMKGRIRYFCNKNRIETLYDKNCNQGSCEDSKTCSVLLDNKKWWNRLEFKQSSRGVYGERVEIHSEIRGNSFIGVIQDTAGNYHVDKTMYRQEDCENNTWMLFGKLQPTNVTLKIMKEDLNNLKVSQTAFKVDFATNEEPVFTTSTNMSNKQTHVGLEFPLLRITRLTMFFKEEEIVNDVRVRFSGEVYQPSGDKT